jgi:hypothetical protein
MAVFVATFSPSGINFEIEITDIDNNLHRDGQQVFVQRRKISDAPSARHHASRSAGAPAWPVERAAPCLGVS